MNIDEWAMAIAADLLLTTDERAPMDVILLAHIDEFEDLARTTRLKIPAFARALTRAGVTLRSGQPYSAETLRAQINRARGRHRLANDSAPPTMVINDRAATRTPMMAKAEMARQISTDSVADGPPRQQSDVLSKLDRLRPRRLSSLEE